MKERPILFSAPMVRSILSGTKTQTRRMIKGDVKQWEDIGLFITENNCPYGQPGDRLWVREACFTDDARRIAVYVADGTTYVAHYKRRNSIHMPRWASRITLEVTGVRVERLQAISEADAVAEGIEKNHNGYFWGGPHEAGGRKQHADPRLSYRDLWDQINGKSAPWASNPYVWVVEFKRVVL